MTGPAERLIALASQIQPDGSLPFPARLICLWSGPVATIPSGWQVCDGTDDAPDLTALFIKAKPHSPQIIYIQKRGPTDGGS